MPARAATPLDLPRISALLASSLRDPTGIMASALPVPLAAGAVSSWTRLLPGLIGLQGRLRVFLEEYRGQLRSSALVYDGNRPEWVVLILAALQQPGGADSAFRLLSEISGSAARAGMHRIFAAVSDEALARETFFQAGFYSYTRETWLVAVRAQLGAPHHEGARRALSSDAHDLFRFYAATTPHAVQRAEQLTVEDFDIGRRAGAFDPPFLVSGNPLAMRRETAMGNAPHERLKEIMKFLTENGERLARVATSGMSLTDDLKARILSTFLTLMNLRENLDRASMRGSVGRSGGFR